MSATLFGYKLIGKWYFSNLLSHFEKAFVIYISHPMGKLVVKNSAKTTSVCCKNKSLEKVKTLADSTVMDLIGQRLSTSSDSDCEKL